MNHFQQPPLTGAPGFLPPMSNITSQPGLEQNTLYVGNLPPQMDELTLYAEFQGFGKIANARIMKDSGTHRSRGFGFVTFERRESAEQARARMNNKLVYRRELRVYFKADFKKGDPKANVVVKNLQREISNRELEAECRRFGPVLSCIVRKAEVDGELRSLGYAYVQFECEQDAVRFREEFSGREINGMTVEVEQFVPFREREQPKSSNVYIKNFAPALTRPQIEALIAERFGELGEITSSGVFRDEKRGRFYAFVAFKDMASAEKAIERFHDRKLSASDPESLYVSLAQSKRTRQKLLAEQLGDAKNKTNMYVRSLRASVTEEHVRRVFGKYGEITSVCLKKWQPKPAQPALQGPQPELQFCFINYRTEEAAEALIRGYQLDPDIELMIDPSNKNPTFVFYAQSRRVRNGFLKMQQRNQMQRLLQQQMQGLPPKMDFLQHRMPPMMQPPLLPQGPPLMGGPGFLPQQGLPPMLGQPQMPPVRGPAPMRGAPGQELPPRGPRGQFGQQLPPQRAMKKGLLEVLLSDMPGAQKSQIIRANQQEFLALPEDDKKQVLGGIIYRKVQVQFDPSGGSQENVGRITGMLIDLDILEISDILDMIDDQDLMKERINEALEVLREGHNDDQ